MARNWKTDFIESRLIDLVIMLEKTSDKRPKASCRQVGKIIHFATNICGNCYPLPFEMQLNSSKAI